MDNELKTIEHYFYDPNTKSIFSTVITLSDLKKMNTDQNYGKFMHEQAMKIRYGQYVQKLELNQSNIIEESSEDVEDTNRDNRCEDDCQYDKFNDEPSKCDTQCKGRDYNDGVGGQQTNNSSQIPKSNISDVNHPKSRKKQKAPSSKQDHPKPSNSSDESRGKYYWQHKDTKLLISSYGTHLEDLAHPVRRKSFWDNICNDMISHNYNVTKDMCSKKWKNLMTSYKNCKDKTGRESSKFAFFEEIDEIVGDKPSNSSGHTRSSLKRKSTISTEKENDKNIVNDLNGAIDTELEDTTESEKKENSKKPKKLTKRQIIQEKSERDKKKIDIMSKMVDIEERKLATYGIHCELLSKYLQEKAKKS